MPLAEGRPDALPPQRPLSPELAEIRRPSGSCRIPSRWIDPFPPRRRRPVLPGVVRPGTRGFGFFDAWPGLGKTRRLPCYPHLGDSEPCAPSFFLVSQLVPLACSLLVPTPHGSLHQLHDNPTRAEDLGRRSNHRSSPRFPFVRRRGLGEGCPGYKPLTQAH
ncbi:PREDICTED: uncharacterized protein LOC105598568 [Cercocebus atys]|uniref:uncharacterized protein LOC105598568 n=1 Tax=Cercocebus atys TaxID=9531 RepID=UPI0005F3D3F4|nr:PREDICTED: uncharacterized protein LOC105598568 [Cercocebus atys]